MLVCRHKRGDTPVLELPGVVVLLLLGVYLGGTKPPELPVGGRGVDVSDLSRSAFSRLLWKLCGAAGNSWGAVCSSIMRVRSCLRICVKISSLMLSSSSSLPYPPPGHIVTTDATKSRAVRYGMQWGQWRLRVISDLLPESRTFPACEKTTYAMPSRRNKATRTHKLSPPRSQVRCSKPSSHLTSSKSQIQEVHLWRPARSDGSAPCDFQGSYRMPTQTRVTQHELVVGPAPEGATCSFKLKLLSSTRRKFCGPSGVRTVDSSKTQKVIKL